jgi:hypothetical protein
MSHIYNNLFLKSLLLALTSRGYRPVFMAYLLLSILMDSYAKPCEKILCPSSDSHHFSYAGVCPESVPRGQNTQTLPITGRKGDGYVRRRIPFCMEETPHILYL